MVTYKFPYWDEYDNLADKKSGTDYVIYTGTKSRKMWQDALNAFVTDHNIVFAPKPPKKTIMKKPTKKKKVY